MAFFQFALYSAPLAFLIPSPYDVPVVGAMLAFQGKYLHSPTRVNFGPLGRYFMDNAPTASTTRSKHFGLFITL